MILDSFLRTKQVVVLSGDVLSVRVIVNYNYTKSNSESTKKLWYFITEEEPQIYRDKISGAMREYLGSEFEVRSLTFGKGSLEILIVIGTAYYAISRYKNFIESINLFVSQVKHITTCFFERADSNYKNEDHNNIKSVSVSTSWSPGAALARAENVVIKVQKTEFPLLLLYLIVSHAALLGLLFWLIVNHFQHIKFIP